MMQGVRSVCPFCSMGCTCRIRGPSRSPYVGDIEVAALDYDNGGPFNRGSLCGKGNMSLELLTHPARLIAPRLGPDAAEATVDWETAFDLVVRELEEVRAGYGAEAIGFCVGPHLTNEEVRRVLDLARVLGTPHVDGGLPEDRTLLGGIERSCAIPAPIETTAQIAGMTALLVVGDIFTQAPCISRSVLDARYERRRNTVGVLGSRTNRTSWFGRPRLRCRPTSEVAALALMLRAALDTVPAEQAPAWAAGARRVLDRADARVLEEFAGLAMADLAPVVEALSREPESGVLIGLDFGETDRPDLAGGLAAMLAELTHSRFLPLLAGPNACGVRNQLAAAARDGRRGMTAAEMVESAVTGDLKALVGFSCDPLGSLPGSVGVTAARRLAFYAFTSPFPEPAPGLAQLVMPCATWAEKAGTVTNAFGADQPLSVVIPAPGGTRADLDILDRLAERVGARPPAVAAPGWAPDAAPCDAAGFFAELDIHLRLEQRERGAREVGSHVLLPEAVPSHAADGWLTRHLSWPRHECPQPELILSADDAAGLGIRTGDRVRVRSRSEEAILFARIGEDLPEGAVLAPPHEPGVRRLMRWRLDSALRDLDLRPSRVSVEPVGTEVEP